MAKDVLKKLENTCEQHGMFQNYCARAQEWMDNAGEVISKTQHLNPQCGKEALEAELKKIQVE